MVFLTDQHQYQQRRQVHERVVKKSSRWAAVSSAIEPNGEICQVGIDWQRVGCKRPRSNVIVRHHETKAGNQQRVLDGLTTAYEWLNYGHHSVASAGIVCTQVPAQCAEVWELPRVHYSSQQPCTWANQQQIPHTHGIRGGGENRFLHVHNLKKISIFHIFGNK